MSEEVKGKRTRRPKVNINVKVSPVDYENLKVYADSIKSKPETILEGLVSEYLERDEVKAVLKGNEKLVKKKMELAKKEREVDELKRENEELESSQK